MTNRRLRFAFLAALAALAAAPAAAFAAPVVLSKLRWSRPFARTSQNVVATYVSDGSTTLSFAIRNAAGAVVRDLGDRVPIAAGSHAVDWDGYADTTFAVPDGPYQLVITGDDSAGISGTTTAPIVIDDRGPTIRFKSLHVKPNGRLVIRVIDTGSGVRSATLLVGSRFVARVHRPTSGFAYRPRGGWARGRYRVTVLARDRGYNLSTVTRTIVVR